MAIPGTSLVAPSETAVKRVTMAVFGAATLGELVLIVVPSPALEAALGLLFGVGLLFAALGADRVTRFTVVPLLMAGGWMLWSAGAPLGEWLRALASLGPVYAMTVAVRLVGIPIELGAYAPRLRQVMERWTGRLRGGQYLAWSTLNYVLSLLALFGALPISYNMMVHALPSRLDPAQMALRKRFIAATLIRSIALAATWGPVSAGAVLSTHIAGIQWQAIVPIGIALSVVGMILSVLLERPSLAAWDRLARPRFDRSEPAVPSPPDGLDARPVADPGELEFRGHGLGMAVFFALLVLIVIGCQRGLGWPIFPSVTTASVLTSVAWMAYLRRLPQFPALLQQRIVRTLPQTASTFALFTALGVFIFALEASHVGPELASLLADHGLLGRSQLGTFILIETLVLAMSFVGIPGIVAIGVVGHPLALTQALDPVLLALALIIGNVMAGASSPFSLSNLLLAALLPNANSVETGIRINLCWSLLFGLVASLVTALAYGMYP